MPALTHGRVINGFNQYARSITYARSKCNRKDNTKCGNQKPACCGNPLQPFKIRPGSYCGSGFCRIPTGPCSRKRASATGVIGRSTMAKRAIYRRVANCQGRTPANKNTKITCSCNKPACRYCTSYGRRFTPLQSFQTPVQFPQKKYGLHH